MTSPNEEHYNRPPIIVDNENQKITIRASQAASCRRQLAYYARKELVSNPPDNIAINRMLAGTYLEAVAVDYLKRTEWNVKSFTDDYDEPPRLTIKLTDDIFISGTPDAHGSHELTTDSKLTVLEIKTRGNAAWAQMGKLGTMGAFPSAIAQLAFYRKGLLTYQKENNVHLIDDDSDGVLVTMNTDTKEVRLFTASDMNLENTLTDLTAKLVPLSTLLLDKKTQGTLPARDYTSSSWQCRYCPFFTTCYDKTNPENIDSNKPDTSKVLEKTSRLQALDALHTYEQAAANVVDNKIYETEKKDARETLLDYLKGEELQNVELIGRAGLSRNIKITTRETTQVDLEQLGQILSTEQYQNIVTLKVTESASVR